MNKTIKYGIQPIYTKKELKNESFKVLYGYIVSKCYVIDENTVLFPYANENTTYIENERKTNDVDIGYNTNYVDTIYNDYDSAKKICDEMNNNLLINGIKKRKLKGIERLINLYTSEMKIEEKKYKR